MHKSGAVLPGRADSRSDRELLDAIGDAGRGALEELYARHAPWLTLRLARRCPQAELVDQAVQDTFLVVWRKPKSYKGQGEVAAWIWGIGIRRLIDLLRRQPKWQWSSATEEALHVSAEEEVLVGIEHGDLPAAINQLSPELRLVVQATVLDGLTTREASRLLGIPTGTVKTRMARARMQLRKALV